MRCCSVAAARQEPLDAGSDGIIQQQLELGTNRTMQHQK
jgi:hypothetical protein